MIVQRTPNIGIAIKLQRASAPPPQQQDVASPRWVGYLTATGEPMRHLAYELFPEERGVWVAEVPGAIQVDWHLTYEVWAESMVYRASGYALEKAVLDVVTIVLPEPSPQPHEKPYYDEPHWTYLWAGEPQTYHLPPWPENPARFQAVVGGFPIDGFCPAVIPAGNTLTVSLERWPLWAGLLRARASVAGVIIGEVSLALRVPPIGEIPT